MKYKLRLRGAETHFDTACFFMPYPVLTGFVFRFKGKLWEVKGVIYNPSEEAPDHSKPREFDELTFAPELTVESFPIV